MCSKMGATCVEACFLPLIWLKMSARGATGPLRPLCNATWPPWWCCFSMVQKSIRSVRPLCGIAVIQSLFPCTEQPCAEQRNFLKVVCASCTVPGARKLISASFSKSCCAHVFLCASAMIWERMVYSIL